MSAPFAIRPFRPEDQPAVRALVLAGLGDHFGFVDETLNPDLDDITSAYVARGALVVVVEVEGRIVGTGTLVEEAPCVGRLVRMSVARELRGRGLGRQLVGHLVEAARARGYRRVLVETNDDWADAIGLYRACGFEDEALRDGEIHLALELTSDED